MIKIKVVDKFGIHKAEAENHLYYEQEYNDGDRIIVETDSNGTFLYIQLEDTLPPAFVYLQDTSFEWKIPFGEKRTVYSPKSFNGNGHLISVRKSADAHHYRNLAFNPYDSHENTNLFPHASANIETRGEAVFAARNVIDGFHANAGHGIWPYQSWGINRDPNAELKLEFGREVTVDKSVITIRADFPHDAWWKKATVEFSDGSRILLPLTKTEHPQIFPFEPRKIHWAILKDLIKAEDPSPFPALTQWEIWGSYN